MEILNILDDHFRLCVASRAMAVFKADDVTATFTQAAESYGNPASMLSDNAAVFTAGPRGGGRVSLELALLTRGITFAHSRPYHPQTCGKVERFHQTVKNWLEHQPRARSGTRVLVLAHDLHVRVLTDHGELLRELTLDPDRDYQPQPKT